MGEKPTRIFSAVSKKTLSCPSKEAPLAGRAGSRSKALTLNTPYTALALLRAEMHTNVAAVVVLLVSLELVVLVLIGGPRNREDAVLRESILKRQENVYDAILKTITLPCSVRHPNSTASVNPLCLPAIPKTWKLSS